MIYFLLAPILNRIKIGYTSNSNVNKRIGSIQTAAPELLDLVGYMEGEVEDESKLHATFQQYRVVGEWFVYSKEIKDFITENTANPTDKVKLILDKVVYTAAEFAELTGMHELEVIDLVDGGLIEFIPTKNDILLTKAAIKDYLEYISAKSDEHPSARAFYRAQEIRAKQLKERKAA